MDALLPRLQDTVKTFSVPHGPIYVGDSHPWKFCMYAPTTEFHLEEAERSLGFSLPLLLRRIFLEVGNGHYGHDSGLCPLSLTSLPEDDAFDATLVELYLEAISQPGILIDGQWPPDILPVWEWGAGMFSCLDLSKNGDLDPPVIRYYNDWHPMVTPRYPSRRSTLPPAFLDEGKSFSLWLGAWLDGEELRDHPFLS